MKSATSHIAVFALITILFASLSGCADPQANTSLTAGYSALDAHNYDAVAANADTALARTPTGQPAAEALYLKGRAFEQRPKQTDADTQADYSSAVRCFNQALQNEPPRTLEAYIRSSAANIDYWQRNYSTARGQWMTAYQELDDSDIDTKSMVLYRAAICRQRLGDFAGADEDFAKVQQLYPDSEAARRARDHQGAKAFWLQLATFVTPQLADSAVSKLRNQGVIATRAADARGRAVVSVGPFPNMATAWSLHERFLSQYPDSMILP
jgi:tetratricopeptide (TPR) repeat protein